MRLPPKLRQRLSCHGLTYGLLLTSTAAACGLLSTGALAASVVQHFAIGAGPLDSALSQFAARANVILSFSPQQTAHLNTPGLEGDYSVEQGFALLLQNSALEAVAQAPGSYILQAAPTGELTLAPTTVSTVQLDGFNQEIAGDVGYKAQNSRVGTKPARHCRKHRARYRSSPVSASRTRSPSPLPKYWATCRVSSPRPSLSAIVWPVTCSLFAVSTPQTMATACCVMDYVFRAIGTTPPASLMAWSGSKYSVGLRRCSTVKMPPVAW